MVIVTLTLFWGVMWISGLLLMEKSYDVIQQNMITHVQYQQSETKNRENKKDKTGVHNVNSSIINDAVPMNFNSHGIISIHHIQS